MARPMIFTSAVGVFAAQRTRLKVDGLSLDVVSEPEAPRPDAILAIAGLHVAELPDGMRAREIVRVFLEYLQRPPKVAVEVAVMLPKRPRQALEMRLRTDGERSHLAARRRFALASSASSSARKSSAGRLLPARYSSLLFRMCSWTTGS